MSNRLLIDESPLQVLPSLAVLIGLNEAIFLQQLHYWLKPTAKYKPHYRDYEGQVRPWVFNTYHNKKTKSGNDTGWQANFPFWSDRTIKRIVSNLRNKELIITTDQFNDHYTNRTLWYTINYDKLNELSGTLDSDKLSPSDSDKLSPSDSDKLSPSRQRLPETTSEILSKPKNSQTNDKPEAKALNNLADAVAKVCGNLDLNVISASTREELKRVTLSLNSKGITPATLPVFESWWYDNTWQGKKGQAPTPRLIGDHWGQFEGANSKNKGYEPPDLTPAQAEALKQFVSVK